MALLDFLRNRRRRSSNSRASTAPQSFRPQLETLETRDCPAVTVPTGLQATAQSATEIKLTWTDSTGENGYRVYRWDGTRSTLIASLNANVTTYTASQLTAVKQYYFQIESFATGSVARSSWVSAVTLPNTITAPTNLTIASATTSQLTLTWTPGTNVTGYRIFMSDGTRTTQVGTANAVANSFTVRNLVQGKTYSFYVQAFNANNSASSAWVVGSTGSTSLTAPTSLTPQGITAEGVVLNWGDSNNETGYRIYRSDGGLGGPMVVATVSANTTSYQLTGMQSGKTYTFYVQAFNATNTANSTSINVTTLAGQPLQPPANFKVTAASSSSALLSWTDSVGAAGYRVYYWTIYGWTFTTVVPQGKQQITIGPLAGYTTHWFMIQAFKDDGGPVANSNFMFVNL